MSARHARWLLVAALVVLAAPAGRVDAQTGGCEPLDRYADLVAPEPTTAGTVTVPLVIHIMERPGRPCRVRRAWPSTALRRLFDDDPTDRRTVASIWGDTSLRFVVREVALHELAPPRDLLNGGGTVIIPTTGPLGTARWEAAFRRLVARVHRPLSVNVYLWTALAPNQAGFGRSTRSGRGKATVWLASKCTNPARMSRERCARIVAHELGHALGLYHSGANRCATVQPTFRGVCLRTSAPCGESRNAERLMASAEAGRLVCDVEARAAEAMAESLE